MFGTGIERTRLGARDASAVTLLRFVSALATAVLVAGCGGATRHPDPSPRTRAAARRDAAAPKVGTTQRVDADGAHLSVTVVKVVDLPSDDDAPVLPGFRGVGVKVKISNAGPAVYDSLATSDISITATDPDVHLLFVPSGLCRTPPQDFDANITAGDHRSGCLAFRIHTQARVTAVTFSPDGRAAGQLSWGR